ncbi:hypothetical protein ZIOFF_012467 [Zingiber officinale]|uniref:glucose-1-phosphate adenylyltransferase n=1 Tax=Zingiber officinale TaxID=94328 RepID=A0A8J5HKP9_ZINOF|nr:hypothetical protein ZIOFF_012467 [Zingiber officinale]
MNYILINIIINHIVCKCNSSFFYIQTEADKILLAAKGSFPIGIGKNSHIRKAIIDKNVRMGENVKIINTENVQEASREAHGYFIKSDIVTIIKDALIPSGTTI